MGWLVVHTWEDWLLLDPIRRNLDRSAPEGWHTVFPQFPRDWTWIWFQPGQIILVAYEENTPARLELVNADIATQGPDAIHPDEIPGHEPFPSSDPAESGDASSYPSGGQAQPFNRVGSVPDTSCSATLGSWTCLLQYPPEQHGKWSLGHLQHANLFGTLSLTPADCSPEYLPLGPLGILWKFVSGYLPHWDQNPSAESTCKYLQEPVRTGTPADRAFDRARASTRLLGTGWPLPPYDWPLDVDLTDDEESQAAVATDTGLFDLSFYLLTPDYTFEQLDLSVVLPQTLWDTLEVVQTCRQADRASFFPCLIPVVPQPDPGWGVLIAAPAWPSPRVIVCCDLSFYDGRIIAVCVPRCADSYLLCELVGLAPLAEVDIYLPYGVVPLQRGEECDLISGNLVTFMRPGSQRPPTFDIHVMLSSSLGWEHSSFFPRDRQDNAYCVVGSGGQVLYHLRPERAPFYRTDIAALVGLPPLHVEITSATASPGDVSVRGWTCRAVLIASSTETQQHSQGGNEALAVGLLDCRPLLGGWVPITTSTGWLDLTPIREMLQLRAPTGWHVVFPQLPSHWTWTCLASGQILVVALAKSLAEGQAERPPAMLDAWGPADATQHGVPQFDSTPSRRRDPPTTATEGLGTPFRREVAPRTRSAFKGPIQAGWGRGWLLFLLLASSEHLTAVFCSSCSPALLEVEEVSPFVLALVL